MTAEEVYAILKKQIQSGGVTPEQIQPDWNQNDSGAADYIKNRPFYDGTNVLLEWDGNTEGLVAATGMGNHVGIPAGTIVGYKIAEYISPLTLPGTTTFLFEDGFTIPLSSDNPFAYVGDENVDIETYIFSEGKKEYGWIAFIKNDNVKSNYASVYYSESGVYWLFGKETEAIKLSQIYMDVFKLPNKYLNLDASLDKDSENPVQNKAVATMEDRLPVVVTSNGRYLASATADYVAEMIEKGVLVAGIPNEYKILTFPEVHSSGSENKVYFFPPYISPDRPNETGRVLVGNELIELDVNPYTRLIPPPLSRNVGKVLMIGTSDEDEAVFSWQNLGALSGTTANRWADVPELLANYDTVLYNADAGSHPEGMQVPALIVAAATERGTRQLSILDGAGQIWTGSVDLSSGTITVKKVDAGIQTLNLGAASDVDIRKLEEGIYRVITDSGEINLNGFNGSVAGSGTPVTMATYSTNCLYLAVSREESSSGITIVVNVLDQAMPTQIVCEANGTGNYVSWTSTKTDIKDICLSKDNTAEYTPTGDYNPATKKYVDDAVSGASAATPRQQMTAEDTTVTLQPGILYVFPEMATLSVTLATPTNTDIVNEYMFTFTSGATATTLSLPDSVITDIAVEPNTYYECSIIDNHMVFHEWEVTT